MGLFGGKKREKPQREEDLGIQLPGYSGRIMVPAGNTGTPVLTSREYRMYTEADTRKKTWYEVLAGLSSQLIKVSPDKDSRSEYERVIAFTGMKITPDDPMSIFVLAVLVFVVMGAVTIITNMLPVIGGIVFIMLGVAIGYWLLRYPMGMLRKARIDASSQIVLAVLYMVVAMRISPNLEGALRFAASNVSGPLAWDMRRLLWDIEMRKYYSIDDAIDSYIVKWKPENEEFAESMRLIKDSTRQIHERARQELDEALNIILEGTKTRMKHYAQDLRTPVMVIHMMGIVLPILGTIMAPLAAVFMSDMVSPVHFILGYDIALPIIIIWFINNTLSKRPTTFSAVDVSRHPDLPKPGYFRMGKKDMPVLPIALIILAAFITVPVLYFIGNSGILLMGVSEREFDTMSLAMSALIILGIGVSAAAYGILSNFQRVKIQKRIQNVESEFEVALLQLGNHIASGTPTELAIQNSMEDVKDMDISGLFRIALTNIRNLGMTFESALFDERYGALRQYPSTMIRNVMYAVVDTSKKGVTYASESMLRIAKYLKNIRETQEYIRDMLSETASSMKFQAYMLTPLITGLIVSMADVIVRVLSGLGKYLEGIDIGSAMGMENIGDVFFNMNSSISPEVFQFIIGVYLIEILAILAMFVNKISVGENKMSMYYEMGKIMLIGVTMYFLVALGASTVFGELIRNALGSLGII